MPFLWVRFAEKSNTRGQITSRLCFCPIPFSDKTLTLLKKVMQTISE